MIWSFHDGLNMLLNYYSSSSPPWRMSWADSMNMTSSAMFVERLPTLSIQRVMKTRFKNIL